LLTQRNEIICDSNLSTNVAELAQDPQEQVGLLAEWARIRIADLVLLEIHVGIGDFGHRSKEEKNNKQCDEACNAKIRPVT